MLSTPTQQMPVLFVGHGSPMNGIEDNKFTQALTHLGKKIPKPKAILCISAHWETEGTWITNMKAPKTIHDFFGFPPSLFEVQYPAPGSQKFASFIQNSIQSPQIHLDNGLWGLDHGTWTILRHIYPNADIPVLQLSIHLTKNNQYHFDLGQQLRTLRQQGVLIIGSGNIVHNLQRLIWDDHSKPYDWAIEFDEWVKKKIIERDMTSLTHQFLETTAGQLSVPTLDHYLPLLYTLGASTSNDELSFEYEGIQNGSISMRTFIFGNTL